MQAHPAPRAGGRGRGRGRGRRPSATSMHSNGGNTRPEYRPILGDLLSAPLQTIAVPVLDGPAKVTIQNVRVLGSPPPWKERELPYSVEPDTGVVFVDENAFRAPNGYAREEGEFDWAGEQVDFITTRNGLRRLLRWIDEASVPYAARKGIKEFRIDTQLAGRTILLNRWERYDQERMGGWSYGLNFEKAATEPALGMTDNTGHQRILCYNLNGLKIVVRYEVDAYLPAASGLDPDPLLAGLTERLAKLDLIGGEAVTETLSDELRFSSSMTSTRASASPEPFTTYHGLRIVEAGTPVPQSSLLDISTRSIRRTQELTWSEFYPQHFLSRTENHYIGMHEDGHFTEVLKRPPVDWDAHKGDSQMQTGLGKLVMALKTIRDLVREHGQRGRLSLVFRNGALAVYERAARQSCLPDEVLERFEE
ncbi:hypothetical protein MKEN_00970700 [Mycena kentingensis (nom. inval.)]|nr:hypothetical protein MKEN_00970700 [Mycena kentingensis (nom. inval.)]